MQSVTVCVDFSDYLSRMLPWNRHHFSKMWVVTHPEDRKTIKVCQRLRIDFIKTDLFYADNASFNKYRSLEYAFDIIGRHGWFCLLDADTIWPKNLQGWKPEIGKFYVPHRRMCPHDTTSENWVVPAEEQWETWQRWRVPEFSGYSQIFNADDPVLGQAPWHELDWSHAGGGDSYFQAKWPEEAKIRPPWEVLHMGEASTHWAGRGNTKKLQEFMSSRRAKMRQNPSLGRRDPKHYEAEKIILGSNQPDCSLIKKLSKPDLSELAIVTTHFNSQKYKLPVQNYTTWFESLDDLQKNLITIELSFDGEFEIESENQIRIHGSKKNKVWQKEALFNHAVRQLPKHIKYVAWIDHDLIFENKDYINQALSMLAENYDVVQLFDTFRQITKTGGFGLRRNGTVAATQIGLTEDGPVAPGGAWMARRNYLEAIGGLYCYDPVGGADQLACEAWLGVPPKSLQKHTEPVRRFALKWRQQAIEKMQGECGFVPGLINHLYHGTRENRQYYDRTLILSKHSFDPAIDVKLNYSGLLEWATNKPELHQETEEYFASRCEDS